MSLALLSRRRFLFNSSLYRWIHNGSSLPIPPDLSVLEKPEDTEKARSWVDKFKNFSIPRNHVELQFARSSGPGGQNVNKVNTKAVVKCPLNSSWIPAWARPELIRSPFYVASSHSIQVSSTVTRSQSQNLDDSLAKLHTAILSAASAGIRNEPSAEQKKKVERLKEAEKAKRKTEKMHRSDVKRNRSSKDWF